MSEEMNPDEPAAPPEAPIVEAQEQEQEDVRQVPLSALEAERKRRQEEAEQRRYYQENYERLMAAQNQQEEDADELITRGALKNETAATRQEIVEELWKDLNPKALKEIDSKLKSIIDIKPWLADSIRGAKNRYARAYEIVQDYEHLMQKSKTPTASSEAARIVQNAQKPGSPVTIAKSAPADKASYLKSIQGKKEFREYREKVRSGEL